jgi:hypothetical protein
LIEEITVKRGKKRKAEKDKKKSKEKHLSSVKEVRSSVVNDTVGAIIESVVLREGEVKMPTDLHRSVNTKWSAGPLAPPASTTGAKNTKKKTPQGAGKTAWAIAQPKPPKANSEPTGSKKMNSVVPSPMQFDSENEDNAKSMSYSKIRELTLDIINLPPHELEGVALIILSREPSLSVSNTDSFEVDFLTLNPSILRELELYVASCLSIKPCKPDYEKLPGKSNGEQMTEKLERRLQNLTRQLGSAKEPPKKEESKSMGVGGTSQLSASSSSSSDTDSSSSSSSDRLQQFI